MKYCTQCHGEEKQNADRGFDMLSQSIGDFREQELWQEIVDQLNLGEMPPEDERQPSEKERLAAAYKASLAEQAKALEAQLQLARAQAARRGSTATARADVGASRDGVP